MANKQKDYLASLLAEESAALAQSPSPALAAGDDGAGDRPVSRAGLSLLGRQSALARVASGEVRQVTQLLLDPDRVRVWEGNARAYAALTEESCRELIDSLIAENGQKVPAVVRRIEGDAAYDYEVIAGTRRHFSVRWLRANNYPEMQFLAQVAQLDDEAAFRLADVENRARADVTVIERARNYAAALERHYGGHLTRMAERLRVSKGWLSKMMKVATLPDDIVLAFAAPGDVQLKSGYALAQAMEEPGAAHAMAAEGRRLCAEQADRREAGLAPVPFGDVLRRLIDAPRAHVEKPEPYVAHSRYGRPVLTITACNRQGVSLRLHSGSGADEEEVIAAVRRALAELREQGRGLQR